jgi:hypothetical protein
MRKWLVASAWLLALGCVNTSVQQLDQAVRPARSIDSVSMLFEKPEQLYTVIAVIDAQTGTVFDSFDDLREEIIVEAAKLGGEAVILGSESTDSEFIFTGIAMIQSDTRKLTGEVIVYERG